MPATFAIYVATHVLTVHWSFCVSHKYYVTICRLWRFSISVSIYAAVKRKVFVKCATTTIISYAFQFFPLKECCWNIERLIKFSN